MASSKRHRVRSVSYKGKSSRGEPAEWITIAPVAAAIRSSNSSPQAPPPRVAPTRSGPCSIAQDRHQRPRLGRDRPPAQRLSRSSERAVRDRGRARHPARPDGAPWRITTRQFRRTIAWHIANRPFGTIAGMIQYKHASVAAFEGYAGSSARDSAPRSRRSAPSASSTTCSTYFDDRRAGAAPSGPAGPRIAGALDAAADELGPLPAMIADRARLRVLARKPRAHAPCRRARRLLLRSSTALCLKRSDARPIAPRR